MKQQSLEGRVVVVVGGAGLLGRAFCAAIAEAGGRVVVADVQGDTARAVAQGLGDAYAATVDITSHDSVEALIADVASRFGRIDAVVNSAYPRNAHYGRRFEDVVYSDFCQNVDLHLGGYFLVAQRFALFFKQQGEGHIINLASIYGSMVPRFEVYAGTQMTMPVEYAAIKAGVIQLTRYIAQYFKGTGVRVNCLSPGGVRDAQPESFQRAYAQHCAGKGLLSAQDVAQSLLMLLADGSRHLTGQNIIVDDGFSL